MPRYPAGFAWGAATSAYQIEGAARVDGKGESIWDRFVRTTGSVADGSTGDIACDHYARWSDDVAVMADLGLTAYRFSIAWTRVLPRGVGKVNAAGLDFYEGLVDSLLAHGIEPWVTLYHWDLPQALEDAGGWPARDTAAAFGEYADVVTRRLGDRVSHWMTVNEPWEVGFLGYHQGIHAPGRTSLADALSAIHTVLLAHGHGVHVIRSNVANARVGLALDLVDCLPDRAEPSDSEAAIRMDGYFNRWFLDPLLGLGYPVDMLRAYGAARPTVAVGDTALISVPLDFVGLNYYYSNWVRAGAGTTAMERLLDATICPPRTPEVTGLGWAIHPSGLESSLRRLARLFVGTDLVVTESGAAFDDPTVDEDVNDADGRAAIGDSARVAYHAAYLTSVGDAIAAGAPVRGYFAWSLLDNFEWSAGYGPRFGIVGVDYRNQRRVPKASAYWYRDIIRAYTVTDDPGLANNEH